MTVGLLHPGEMGAALGAALSAGGETVVWASAGRSAATAARARDAGLEDVGEVRELCRRSDVVIAVCPPHAAVEVAGSLRDFAGIYLDANAISPMTARSVSVRVGRFVDGGIIGPPPSTQGTTRLYLSGAEAKLVADLFVGTVVDARIVSADVGAASAVKMAYAAWTKGSSALVLATRALARAQGVEDTLLEEWRLSLPHLLGTELDTIPAEIPYLAAPATTHLSAELQTQVQSAPGHRLGLCWSPNLQQIQDYKRYCPLDILAPLFELAGISWYSLYKGRFAHELAPYAERVVDLGSHFADFADTAWAIERLDLVITIDTAVAHLAGAMGKPVWILLPFASDWRWLHDRDDSPWYPSARLFRQPSYGDWRSVSAQLAAALHEFIR